MKRFWLVMLSLGLVLAFSASAMAVDVKFSGSYYAAGMYLDKVQLRDRVTNGDADAQAGTSSAFFFQRLRLQTDFIVSPGLSVVSRFDAMERIWGGARNGLGASDSAGTRTENENIAFDHAYLQYVSPIGFFRIGYQPDSAWGTVFGDSEINGEPVARITYGIPVGPVGIGFTYTKMQDNSVASTPQTNAQISPQPPLGATTAQTGTDRDYDMYSLSVNYTGNKTVQAGLVGQYRRLAQAKARGASGLLSAYYPYLAQSYALNPYARAKFGPVAIEAEATYAWGDGRWEGYNYNEPNWNASARPPQDDIKIVNISAYVNVVADFKMVYVGGTAAYVSGDDPGTSDQLEGGIATGGRDFNPTLIMFNYDRTYWAGADMNGYAAPISYAGWATGDRTTNMNSPMMNVWFMQAKVGVRPVAALDIYASVSYANADKKPATYNSALSQTLGGTGALNTVAISGVENNRYGWEVDVVGTYKITNNLSYMLGGGYLWTGDFFKGTTNTFDSIGNLNGINNNYLLINKLTLTF